MFDSPNVRPMLRRGLAPVGWLHGGAGYPPGGPLGGPMWGELPAWRSAPGWGGGWRGPVGWQRPIGWEPPLFGFGAAVADDAAWLGATAVGDLFRGIGGLLR